VGAVDFFQFTDAGRGIDKRSEIGKGHYILTSFEISDFKSQIEL